MGTSTRTSDAEPTPDRLPDALRLGTVTLQVADLDRSVVWYRDVVGARLLSTTRDANGRRAHLGAPDSDDVLLTLQQRSGADPMPSRGRLGLFHVAWLLPDRAALGRLLAHLGQAGERVGSADHLVSEAVYLQDPDGLGVEVYVDRPRDEWSWRNDQVEMASLPLDASGLLRAAGGGRDARWPAGTRVGHVHLHVGDLAASTRFYRDVVGFTLTQTAYPGAHFLSTGGYHHHLGTNVWAGARATPPSPSDAQLLSWELLLPDAAAVDALTRRAQMGKIAMESVPEQDFSPAASVLRDPWGTALRVRIEG